VAMRKRSGARLRPPKPPKQPALAPRTGLPREAREGLMRAWLDILRTRHPELAWMPAEIAEK
jgi:hypothetical protein